MEEKRDPTDPTSKSKYEVGYRKPPKHSRFKPGQSGNPRGRTKGTKNLKTDLMEELGEKIVIREGDRSQKVSKQRALLKSVVNRAIKGDARAIGIALSTMMRLLDTGEGAPDVEEVLGNDELEILKAFEDRLLRSNDSRTADQANQNDDKEDPS